VATATPVAAEFNQLQTAFSSSTGHTHNGTGGEGAPITVMGPAQDLIVSDVLVRPKVDDTMDLGSPTYQFKEGYFNQKVCASKFIADAGSLSVPSFSFGIDDNLGMYRQDTDSVGFQTDGTLRMRINTTEVRVETGMQVVLPDGTAAAPSIATFASGRNTGFYSAGTEDIGISLGGSAFAKLDGGDNTIRLGDLTTSSFGTSGTVGVSIADIGSIQIARAGTVITTNKTDGDGTSVTFNRNGTTVGTISVAAGVTAYNTSSDYRLKTVIAAPNGYDPTERITDLADCLTWFEWKDYPEVGPQFGALAHVLSAVAPYAVSGVKDDVDVETENIIPQGVDWSKLIPDLIAGLNAANQKIADLTARIEVLENA
jgi:hypothetical protein